jgi:class 3 adenylate cyclase
MNDDGAIDDPVQRKLAAIMSADVVGYSRLMGLDDAETLRRLSDLRKVVDTLIEQRGGRIAGTGGDSVLAEFPSVVEAAACAVEIQQANGALNATHSEDTRMLLRVGLNVGDVIVQDDTIFGDGVNVAARLEAMAPAGGICISQLARDHLRDKASYTFEDLGILTLKNIVRPVQAFTLMHDPASGQNDTNESKEHLDEATPTEIAFWESIQESTGSKEYAAYLKQYPEGRFSAVAKARWTDLETAPELPAEEALKVELLFWESVKDSSDPEPFQAYLDKYPQGQFVTSLWAQ